MPERLNLRDHLPYFAAVGISSPFLIFLFLYDYYPGWDESFQLLAAVRFSQGLGLTIYDAAGVLRENDFRFLAEWAPGYSLLISAWMKTGISLDMACKLFKVATILLCLYAWFRLAVKSIRSAPVLFLLLAFLAGLLILNHTNITDLIIMALYACLTLLITGELKYRLIWISLLLSVMILLKYSVLFLLPATALWLMAEHRKEWRRGIIRAVLALALPLLTWGVLMLLSKTTWGRFTMFDKQPLPTDLATIIGYLPGIVTEWFTGLTVKPFFGYVTNLVLLDRTGWVPALIFLIFAIPLLTLFLVRHAATGSYPRKLVAWFLTGSLTALVMFGLLTLKYPREIWYPAREVRYFLFLSLLLYMMLLSVPYITLLPKRFGIFRNRIIRSAVFFLVLGVVTLFTLRFGEIWKAWQEDRAFITGVITDAGRQHPGHTPVAVAYTAFSMFQWNNHLSRTVLVQPSVDYFPHRLEFTHPALVFFAFRDGEISGIRGVGPNLDDLSLRRKKHKDLLIAWRPFKHEEKFKK